MVIYNFWKSVQDIGLKGRAGGQTGGAIQGRVLGNNKGYPLGLYLGRGASERVFRPKHPE